MGKKTVPAPLGNVEPDKELLNQPPDEQVLYKIMRVEDLLRSLKGNYLHFNRVDSYSDFPGADTHDGEQLPQDRDSNERMKFINAPNYSGADYLSQARSRTYACCFSLENSDYNIWKSYANDTAKGKVCVVFNFGKLRDTINNAIDWAIKNNGLEFNGKRCRQIFSVNYGIVEYVERENHRANNERINQIIYTYLKDKKYEGEKELRISLSAIGIGQVVLSDGSIMPFPNSLPLTFDFRPAIANQTIQQILLAPGCDSEFVKAELRKLHLVPIKGQLPT